MLYLVKINNNQFNNQVQRIILIKPNAQGRPQNVDIQIENRTMYFTRDRITIKETERIEKNSSLKEAITDKNISKTVTYQRFR